MKSIANPDCWLKNISLLTVNYYITDLCFKHIRDLLTCYGSSFIRFFFIYGNIFLYIWKSRRVIGNMFMWIKSLSLQSYMETCV